MNLIRRASVAWVCGLALSVGFGSAPSVAAGPAEGLRARLAAPPQDDLATFSADFWATHFGLPYTPGFTALMLTANSISINGLGQWDAGALGETGIAAVELFAAEPALRAWTVQVAGVGGVLATEPAVFTESFRHGADGMVLSAEQLAAGGLESLSVHAAAGEFVGGMGVASYVYGYVGTIVPSGGLAGSVFVPLGSAPTRLLAEERAARLALSTSRAVGSAVVGIEAEGREANRLDTLIEEIPPEDCEAIHTLCVASKALRRDACKDRAHAIFIATLAAGAVGCAALTVGGPACMFLVFTAAASAQNAAISACDNDYQADLLDCDADRIRCLAQ